MSYPLDRLAALANANFMLWFRLAEIARQGGLKAFQAAAATANALAEEARWEGSCAEKAAALSDEGACLFAEIEKIGQLMATDTRAVTEKWQATWSAAIAVSDEAELPEGASTKFSRLPWTNGAAAPSAPIAK